MSISLLNLSFQLTGIILCLLGILQVAAGPKHTQRMRYYFIAMFFILICFDVSNLLGQIFRGMAGPRWRLFLLLVNFGEFFSANLLLFCLSMFLASLADPEGKNPRTKRRLKCMACLQTVFLIVSQFSPLFYYIDSDNIYRRGLAYPLVDLIPLLMFLYDLWIFWNGRENLSGHEKNAFFICILLPLLATVVQPFIYGVYVVIFACVLAAIVMYFLLRIDETERFYAKEQENANLKINILLSQIQPHFIYNSLFVIQQLCMTDAELAGKAIGSFTQYLRHNMDSITMDTPIPFKEELNHVQCYVELQQLRFGERLHVEYDLGCTDFCLPTLTLQPIVENAVRYGVRKTASGEGTVRILSREMPDRVEVTVKDDGPGFVPETLGGEPEKARVGLRNVRERLEKICGGELRIETKLGKGTTVTLVLPKKGKAPAPEKQGLLSRLTGKKTNP